jgi:3-hydroxymyristoyl/3-hydroxydecanoyl-(acyl carrier protein) dehydratase
MNSPMQSTLDIAPDHPAYAGHFPTFPVLPGAVLIDAVLAALERARHIDLTQWQLSVAKFLSAVRPGEPLHIEHEISAGGLIRFTVRSKERAVATGTLSQRARAG